MTPSPARAGVPLREGRLYALLALLALAVLGADAYVMTRGADATVAAAPAAAASAGVPVRRAALAAQVPPTCAFRTDLAPVANWASLVTPQDATLGNARAAVTVVEFFEPNCPHCAHLHPVMKEVARQQGRAARFVFKPVVFWPKSMIQTQALYAAQAEGKFFPLLDLQMSRQKAEGFNDADVRAMAVEVGMNADALAQRIQAGQYRGLVEAQRQAFRQTGANAVPLVLINGRAVGEDRSATCLAQLIQQTAAAARPARRG